MDDLDVLTEELLQDPATRAAYEARRPAFELASRLFGLRTALGLTQKQVAEKAGITQPEVARLESASVDPTWETISRVFGALGASLELRALNSEGRLLRFSISPAAPRPRGGARKARAS